MSSSIGWGRSATGLLLQPELGGRQGLALAGRAELLPVARGAAGDAGHAGHAVVEAEAVKRQFQIVDVHPRGEALAAAGAESAFSFLSRLVIELDAELGRPLEDVEELAEGEVQEG